MNHYKLIFDEICKKLKEGPFTASYKLSKDSRKESGFILKLDVVHVYRIAFVFINEVAFGKFECRFCLFRNPNDLEKFLEGDDSHFQHIIVLDTIPAETSCKMVAGIISSFFLTGSEPS